jgi:hypothetical protein
MQRYFLFFDLCIGRNEKRKKEMLEIKKRDNFKKKYYYLYDTKSF